MREGEPQAVLPCSRKERGHQGRRHLVELVKVEEEVPARTGREILAGHRRLVEGGDEEAPQERGVLFSDRALGELREENLAPVHHPAEVEPVLALHDHPPHEFRPEEGVESREDRPLGQALQERKFALPVVPDLGVGNGREEPGPEVAVHEEAPEVEEGSASA